MECIMSHAKLSHVINLCIFLKKMAFTYQQPYIKLLNFHITMLGTGEGQWRDGRRGGVASSPGSKNSTVTIGIHIRWIIVDNFV